MLFEWWNWNKIEWNINVDGTQLCLHCCNCADKIFKIQTISLFLLKLKLIFVEYYNQKLFEINLTLYLQNLYQKLSIAVHKPQHSSNMYKLLAERVEMKVNLIKP